MSLFRRGTTRVTPDQAHERVAAQGAMLLDVREQAEWTAGHAPGAVHVPLSRLVTGTGLPADAQGRLMLVICRSGHRSQQAAKLLAGHGVEAVDVKGGMSAWTAAGLPVVDECGNSGRIA
ncbi:rhodanese-like domain-containing protein [Streptomyces sp. NPDC097617]|uniref:rhodanese-like domain-containing protein n=1 Tax=Streptomyces sp. NPDC097617 TaxID=3366091 RepID=UPI003823527B